MKNKLLNLLRGETAAKRGRQGGSQRETPGWMKDQIKKMNSLNQEIVSVKAVRQ